MDDLMVQMRPSEEAACLAALQKTQNHLDADGRPNR